MGVPRYTPERTKSLKKEKKKKIPTDITTLLTDFSRPLNHQLSGIAWGQRKNNYATDNTIGAMEFGIGTAKIPKMATNPNFLAGWCHMTCKGSKYPCLRTMDCKQLLPHLRRKVNLPVIPAVSPFPVSSFLFFCADKSTEQYHDGGFLFVIMGLPFIVQLMMILGKI